MDSCTLLQGALGTGLEGNYKKLGEVNLNIDIARAVCQEGIPQRWVLEHRTVRSLYKLWEASLSTV